MERPSHNLRMPQIKHISVTQNSIIFFIDVVGETENCDVYEERSYADCVDQKLKVNLYNSKIEI